MYVAIKQAHRCEGKNRLLIDLEDLLLLLQRKALCWPHVKNASIIDWISSNRCLR